MVGLAYVPKMGMIVPEMGMGARKAASSGLAGALFSPVQQRVLGLLFGQPERRFQSAEIIQLAAGGTGAAHRQLQKLEKVGLVLVTRSGSQKYYQVNPDSPIYPELHGLVVKTVGLVEPLRAALAPLAKEIELAFVFGSLAKGTEKAGSDVDLLIVSDTLSYPDLYEALQRAEAVLARPVKPSVFTRAEWKQRRGERDSFVRRIAEQPKYLVIGNEDALA